MRHTPNVSRTILRAAAALFCAGASLAWPAEPLPVATFFQKSKYGDAVLSPSGKYLAVVTPVKDRRNIAIVDLDTRAAKLLTSNEISDVVAVSWLNDERLSFTLGDLQRGTGEPPRISALIALNRDGSQPRELPRSFARPFAASLLRPIAGSDDVFMVAHDRDIENADLYRVDSKTGAKKLLSFDTPGKVTRWVLDFDNVPRAVVTADLDKDRSAWYVRKTADSPWQLVREGKFGALASTPVGFSGDGKVLFVESRERRDRVAVFEFDMETGKLGDKPVVQHPERDITGTFVNDYAQHRVLALNYQDDTPSRVWFEPEFAKMQQAIDAALPDTDNVLQKARDGDRWIVIAFSDRNPGVVYLLDGRTKKMEKLFEYAPWFRPEDMAATKWVRYKARDGLVIPALLTVPKGMEGKRVPLIVDIHGGPYVEATRWGFSPEVQFLASRGYAVLQPQFRGTGGFGWKHASAGYRQWGEAMQDDLDDGIRWAVEQGVADKDRVCLFGASYGGYAAMWGAIRNPQELKCAVAFVGVSSIDYLFDNAQTDVARLAEHSSTMARQIGDPKTERARFRRVNPVDNAERAGVPILLAYGVEDVRVPLVHGTDFKAALDRYNKPYEWVTYSGEGHGFNRTENRVDFYTRVEKFLAKYLAPQ